jgi:hypothetical protein
MSKAGPSVRGTRTLDQRDAREFSKAAKIETHKITKNATTAKAYLVEAGFITKAGKLAGRYADRGKR